MRGEEYSDEELIRELRLAKSIDKPVRFIYTNFYGLLSSYIEQNMGTKEDAEDIFQEVILTFIELVKKDKFRGESSVKTFLFAVNRNIWLNERKKRGRQEKRHDQLKMQQADMEPEIEKYISNREARMKVFAIIDSLGEVCKTILLSFYYENLSIGDILKKLNYENEQVVRNKKSKCMKSLQEKLMVNPQLANIMKKALQYE